MTARQKLLEATRSGNLATKNRFGVAPMTRVTATEDGRATETMTRYYERFARGGFGLVVTEGIYTDQAHSQGYVFQPGITDEAQARSWQPLVKGIQSHGSLAIAQIMHAGGISQGNRFRDTTVAPSAILPKGQQMAFYYGKDGYAMPTEITEAQIAEVIKGFADSAARAVEIAGFDGIEIHGANGYLLDQFLTNYTNTRTDQYGGSTENRIRLAVEVVKAARARVGSGVPVGIRISQAKVNDYHHKWANGEADAAIIFGALAEAGVDFIHVTEFEAWQPAFGEGTPTLVHLAKTYAPNALIIANGSLHDTEKAEAVIADGADIVTIGRGALANPDLPIRLAEASELREFDPAILGPIADIKDSELAL
ncbi:NADH:flavin oxidoreductase [Paracoccus laeviglucosivorans]|uniref:2,4-dienoyl-CoA reductase n=1 Tax=Paracoccus laeviglucosivorans TaxID=1197861 RepID=A0A521FSG2_9RHOB|nr:NADH:flavin oxidoreductase [Paracoccus laeviglucosivorans]SMO98431.1 2,4-dienoyl-CoA reductase [Paracoccus laeviglucosivorans]